MTTAALYVRVSMSFPRFSGHVACGVLWPRRGEVDACPVPGGVSA